MSVSLPQTKPSESACIEVSIKTDDRNHTETVLRRLQGTEGVESYTLDVGTGEISITGSMSLAQLTRALQLTERQVSLSALCSSLTGSLHPAAVSILELPYPKVLPYGTVRLSRSSALPSIDHLQISQNVIGVCRFVQLPAGTISLDLTFRLPSVKQVGAVLQQPILYDVYISSTGNLVSPPATTGRPLQSLGRVSVDENGYGDLICDVEGELGNWIGRACVLQRIASLGHPPAPLQIAAGVVARSTGKWGKDKSVSACSGRKVWEEYQPPENLRDSSWCC